MLYEGFFVILYKKKRILMKRKKLKKLNLNKKTITNFKETIKGGTLNKTEDEITLENSTGSRNSLVAELSQEKG